MVSGPSWTCPQCTWRRCTSLPFTEWHVCPELVQSIDGLVGHIGFPVSFVFFLLLTSLACWERKELKSTSQVVIYFRSSEATTLALFLYQFNHFGTQDWIKNSHPWWVSSSIHTSRPQQCCFFSLDHRGQLATATWSTAESMVVMKAVKIRFVHVWLGIMFVEMNQSSVLWAEPSEICFWFPDFTWCFDQNGTEGSHHSLRKGECQYPSLSPLKGGC